MSDLANATGRSLATFQLRPSLNKLLFVTGAAAPEVVFFKKKNYLLSMTTNSPGAGGRWADHRQVPTLKRNLWASTPVRLTGSSRCPDCTASRILSMTASQKGCFGREARMALHTNTPSRFSSNLAWIWGSVLRNPGNLTMRQARDCLSSSLHARFSFSKKNHSVRAPCACSSSFAAYGLDKHFESPGTAVPPQKNDPFCFVI